MSPFRQQVQTAFGADVAEDYLYVHPGPPRIRFELGVGSPFEAGVDSQKRAGYFADAETRCRMLLDFLADPGMELWVQMAFFDCATPYREEARNTQGFLAGIGLIPLDGDWLVEEVPDEDDQKTIIGGRYSARIAAGTAGLRAIPKIVVWTDFGSWQGHGGSAYFFNATEKLLYHPYDDRGADLLASTVDVLRSWYTRFNNWILDFDRPWIDKMFTIAPS